MDRWASPQRVGRRRASQVARRVGRELRLARLISGRTQTQVAEAAGLSQSSVSRLELGALPFDLERACRAAAAVGHELGAAVHPLVPVGLRDRGQLGVAQAMVAGLHPSWRPSLEVPVGSGADRRADRRAVDIVLVGDDEIVAMEIERWLVDVQAQLRAHQLKRATLAARHSRPVRLVLVMRDTPRHRTMLAPHEPLLRQAGFVIGRPVWESLRHGGALGTDGIVWFRPRDLGHAHGPTP